MKRIIMYSKPNCGFCKKAKSLLDEHGVPYEERIVGVAYTADQVREHCVRVDENAVVSTVPQIILEIDANEEYIGGYTELATRVHLKTL